MDYSDFEQTLQQAGVTKKEFAALMGLNASTVTNYASRQVPRHLAVVAVLCRELNYLGSDFRKLVAGVPKIEKKPRPRGFQGDRQRALF